MDFLLGRPRFFGGAASSTALRFPLEDVPPP